nr:DMT family transporter [uncultured Moellerella sp.]
MLLFYIIIALTNGIFIIFSRSINGRLSQGSNAFYASLINHIVGFLFLTAIILITQPQFSVNLQTIPLIAFTGGIIGACFVVVNSYILPLLGATLTTILAISGQVLSGIITDIIQHGLPEHFYIQLIGVAFILSAIGVHHIRKTP